VRALGGKGGREKTSGINEMSPILFIEQEGRTLRAADDLVSGFRKSDREAG